jgi:hypothetical protein
VPAADGAPKTRSSADAVIVAALAAGSTQIEAAQKAGVSESTVYRRMQDDAFRAEVDSVRREMLGRTAGLLADVSPSPSPSSPRSPTTRPWVCRARRGGFERAYGAPSAGTAATTSNTSYTTRQDATGARSTQSLAAVVVDGGVAITQDEPSDSGWPDDRCGLGRCGLGGVIRILLAAGLGLAVSAVPAAAAGLPETPVPDRLPKCAAGAARMCVPIKGSPGAASLGLTKVTTSTARRRGLGLPPAGRILGRRAAKLLAASDRALAARLAAPLTEPKGMRAGAAKIRRGLAAKHTVRRGYALHAREMRLEMQVDACPDPTVGGNSHGTIAIEGRGRYTVTNIARYGRRYVLDSVELELAVDQRGLVSHRAFYAGSLAIQPNRLRITRSRSIYDPRTRTDRNERASRFDFLVSALDPVATVQFQRESFEGWIEREEARERGEPDPHADDPLASASYKDVARQFVRWMGLRLQDVVREAEANWRTPNRCVRLDLDGPPKLAPSGVANIRGTLTPVGGVGTKEGLYGEFVHYAGSEINGGTLANLGTLPLDMTEPWFQYTAPGQPWQDSARPGADVTATTKGGIARATKTFELLDELYFRLVGYNHQEQSVTAYGTSDTSHVITAPGPVVAVDACTSAAPCVPFFQLQAPVRTTTDGDVRGSPNAQICPGGQFDYGISTLDNTMRVQIAYDPRTTGPATHSASMIPEVGDVFVDYCGAHDFAAATAPAVASASHEELLSGRPVAFAFAASGAASSEGNHPGTPIQWSITGTATVQRVEADGSPLAGSG